MLKEENEISIPSVRSIRLLLEPINEKLAIIEQCLKKSPQNKNQQLFYRNNDLKQLFGLCNNTIIKYRETGVIPFTRLGDIYLYDVKLIHEVLDNNKVSAIGGPIYERKYN